MIWSIKRKDNMKACGAKGVGNNEKKAYRKFML